MKMTREDKFGGGAWAGKMLLLIECCIPLDDGLLIREMGYEIPELLWLIPTLTVLGGYDRALRSIAAS